MRKKVSVLLLILVLIMNQAAPMGIKAADAADEVKVYVENGEGSLTEGDGTAQRPYQNIRTALKQIQTGQTLVLVGEVSYTKYETYEDKSPKPLFIDKDITIVGSDTSAGLKIRSMIQLGADVTFRDMWLQMVPQAGNARGTTIYAAGHTLVLDAVDTRVGTSTLQDDVRPLISGGAYQGEEGKMGSHTTIKVVNPISQTKIAAIYAGDYYRDSEQDKVDIELDSKLVDTEIHAAGADGHTLTGNVNVTLGKDSNVTDFDKTDLIGELNVNVKAGAHIDTLSFSGINNLTMAEKSRITLPKEADFNVNNVVCEKNAVLDLRQMSTNPSVANNFTGVTVAGEDQTCGSVLVGNDTTLEIKGEVYGLTKLNVNGSEYMARFVENHCYIQAKASSSGNFTIEGTQYTNFQLNKKKTEEIYSWIIGKLENEDADDFYWIGDADKKSVISQQGKEYYYPVEFKKADGTVYKPTFEELFYDYDLALTKENGEAVDLEEAAFCSWDEDCINEGQSQYNQVLVSIYDWENCKGELTLTLTHSKTGKSISRVLLVGEEQPIPTVTPTPTPTMTPTPTPTVAPPTTPTQVPTPTVAPTATPTQVPTPTMTPTTAPTTPTQVPTPTPTVAPTATPTQVPTPTVAPTATPTQVPTPTMTPTPTPTVAPTTTPTQVPTPTPTMTPTPTPTVAPTTAPTTAPTQVPTPTVPTPAATEVPSSTPDATPVILPTLPTVTPLPRTSEPRAFTLNKTAVTLYTKGKKIIQLSADTESVVKYTSDNEKVAVVDENGRVTAKKAGTALITASADGYQSTCRIVVKKPTFKVAKKMIKVKKGKKARIIVKVRPTTKVVFASANKKIAAVTKKGMLKGMKKGQTKIKVKCYGITKTVIVIVK
ncbi:MAG: Ig-like domain-containing protein [Eubacterium sp.]